jgi:glycosyltransferase involved in cell wall biosynthesis
MFVSVVLPTRNAEWCLPYALKALLNQVVQPDEYVICIGKSEDRTEELIMDFKRKSPVPVELCYDREGIGTGYAMGQLLAKAKGDIILWANSDGIKSKYWVKRSIGFFDTNPDISYLTNSGVLENPNKILTADPETIPVQLNIKRYDGVSPLLGIIAFRKQAVVDVGGFDPLFTRGQDLDAVVRMSLAGKKGADCGLQGYHFGVYGTNNLKKTFKSGTFFKFLYKFGWKYCIINPHHLLGTLFRSIFLFSLIFTIITLLFNFIISLFFIKIMLLSLLCLSIGIIISHSTINMNLLIFQMLESIGEYYQLYLFIRIKEKPSIGYGLK